MRGLKGKVAIVAGAVPGNIGGATASRLAQEGMKVISRPQGDGGQNDEGASRQDRQFDGS